MAPLVSVSTWLDCRVQQLPYNFRVAHKSTTTFDEFVNECQGQRQTRGKTKICTQDKNAVTVRPVTLVRPAETLAGD